MRFAVLRSSFAGNQHDVPKTEEGANQVSNDENDKRGEVVPQSDADDGVPGGENVNGAGPADGDKAGEVPSPGESGQTDNFSNDNSKGPNSDQAGEDSVRKDPADGLLKPSESVKSVETQLAAVRMEVLATEGDLTNCLCAGCENHYKNIAPGGPGCDGYPDVDSRIADFRSS